VAISADGRRALSTGALDGRHVGVVWNVATGREQRLLQGHAEFLQSVAFAADSRRALSGSPDGTVRLWDVETGGELRRCQCPGHVASLACAPDGRQALFGVFEGTVVVWDVENWTELRRFDHGNGLWSVDYCPTRRYALTAGGRDEGNGNVGVIRLWDLDGTAPV
jgi:WD40 repeat protein